MTIFFSLPFIVTILTFFFHTIVWHHTLGTTIAFPALAYSSVLRIPLNRMADSITYLIRAHVSLLRVTKFLEETETEKAAQSSVKEPTFIGFDNATLTWPIDSSPSRVSDGENVTSDDIQPDSQFRLDGLDVKFWQNSLNLICGSSGSGKSSLLLALLGEMHLQRGKVFLPQYHRESTTFNHGEVSDFEETAAYCPHEPWIINQSIRANILLETPFDATRYEMVLQSVKSVEDLAIMTEGDLTFSGRERESSVRRTKTAHLFGSSPMQPFQIRFPRRLSQLTGLPHCEAHLLSWDQGPSPRGSNLCSCNALWTADYPTWRFRRALGSRTSQNPGTTWNTRHTRKEFF